MSVISHTRFVALVLSFTMFFACSKDDSDDQPAPVDPATLPKITSVTPLSGPKNTQVTIYGQNFGNTVSAVNVTVNGKQAQISWVTPVQIRIVVPPGAGDGKIIVSVDAHSVTGPDFDFIYTVVSGTLCGSPGTAGFADGTSAQARFNYPRGMCIDGNNNIYVADGLNHRIRRVSPGGTVITFAGSGQPGHQDGSATTAKFSNPYDIALDAVNGYLYVADKDNHCIRKLDLSGTVYTVAGIPGVAGYVDAPGTAGRLNAPTGVEVKDELVNVFIADAGNNCIRRLDATSVLTTFAGSQTSGTTDGTGTAARFNSPFNISWDPAGNFYVCDRMNNKIRKISASGVVTTFAGDGTAAWLDGPALFAWMHQPCGMYVSNGWIVLTDTYNNRIREVNSIGAVNTLAGDGTPAYADGPGTQNKFKRPSSIVRDSNGVFYIADTENHVIRTLVVD